MVKDILLIIRKFIGNLNIKQFKFRCFEEDKKKRFFKLKENIGFFYFTTS